MMQLQNLRSVIIYAATSLTNGATGTSAILDSLNTGVPFDEVRIDIYATTANATNTYPGTCKLSEGDTTSSLTDITSSVGGTQTSTSVSWVFAAMPTSTSGTTGPLVTYFLDMRKRKRYVQASFSPTTTQTVTMIATLGVATELPTGATRENVLNKVLV